ncbi:MAG: C45 family peptidase [Planctomycetaceae bacterium]
MAPRTVKNGRLEWIEGQRVATLWGTPEEIGTAHGLLLPDESRRCIESVLYTFGLAHVIRTGHWFRQDLMAAYERLSPFIPERHKMETRAIAAALNIDAETAETLNVFPEMFHCSGFAVFGSATKDGKLYHGRVLDYMTTIGLQDAATTFIIEPKGQIAFANVGYAAFTGSVSGMNAEMISLGEMGGRGEGNWDGVPMATLMRRALEECRTLDEVKHLWTENPRTCEYYYVFADGETNQAVGVAATPESIEFIDPGQGHERLGEGIPDAVVLSAGSRLEELRRRVKEKHGLIDEELGMWLMSRPVAMQSNLHNVLFIPADGVLYVANASHRKPAAEMPYVRIDLKKMLSSNARQTQVPRRPQILSQEAAVVLPLAE